MNNNKTIAFMYDFDETLAPNYMQDKDLIPDLGYKPSEFWDEVNEYGEKHNMDSVLAYLYFCLEVAKKKNIDLTYDKLKEYGSKLVFFKGLDTWFERINQYGSELGLNVEHYIISSGMVEMIEGTSIAKYCKKIFGCQYLYDENNRPIWPSQTVNYTTKTQYIFRIRKNDLDNLNSSKQVNSLMPREQKLPYENMVYFGDGFTDIPCMKLIRVKGGHSVCVYSENNEKSKRTANTLLREERVDFIAPTDYSEGSELDIKIKRLLAYLSSTILQSVK